LTQVKNRQCAEAALQAHPRYWRAIEGLADALVAQGRLDGDGAADIMLRAWNENTSVASR
jgi:hypothetical protein